MSSGNVALIDYDILVYRVGFACESVSYLVNGVEYLTKKEAVAAGGEIDRMIKPETLESALKSLKETIDVILEGCRPVKEYRGYLTGKNNFREKVATLKPYKGNRKDSPKPYWYSELRQQLVDHHYGEVIDGMEADDKLVIEFCKSPKDSILCSIDKDFLQVPHLRFYNLAKREHTYVNQQSAHRNFFTQVLMGDSTDNIPGLAGIGPKRAEKLLAKSTTYWQMEKLCRDEYRKAFGESQGDKNYAENVQLLYLLRTEGDTYATRTQNGG